MARRRCARSASVADARHRLLSAVLAGWLSFAGGALAGDLGRSDPSVLTDRMLPAVGDFRAWVSGNPVSSTNRSDTEQLLDNRLVRFLSSVQKRDWAFDIVEQLYRSRVLLPGEIPPFGIDRYYGWLHDTDFRSSGVRYAAMLDDIGADLATLPDTFAAICAVQETDRQRLVALANVPIVEVSVADDVKKRIAANRALINWFVNALIYRYQSYGYALDHLLVETPDSQARGVDRALTHLEHYVRQAQRGKFCGDADTPQAGNPTPWAPVISGRILRDNTVPAKSGPTVGS
jgi:hypothetical protein